MNRRKPMTVATHPGKGAALPWNLGIAASGDGMGIDVVATRREFYKTQDFRTGNLLVCVELRMYREKEDRR